MAGKVRYLLNRDGRYFARLVIPAELRPFMESKTELRTPLGPDYRQAMRNLPGAVATMQHEIALAERRAAGAGVVVPVLGRYPMSNGQIALQSYQARLVQDEDARNQTPAYARIPINDEFVGMLRSGIAGALSDADLKELVGHRIDHFKRAGNTSAVFGSVDWRALARAVCISELEALERVHERNEGNYDGVVTAPMLTNATPPQDELPPVSI